MLTLEKKCPNFGEGYYGCVFYYPNKRATKVFKRRDNDEQHVKAVFESEVEAYKLASLNPDLSRLIPEFFGKVCVEKIIDAAGCDISHEFYLNYAYQMERIEGKFVKLSGLDKFIWSPVTSMFQSSRIFHTSDASVVVEKGSITSVIDFATREFIREHPTL